MGEQLGAPILGISSPLTAAAVVLGYLDPRTLRGAEIAP